MKILHVMPSYAPAYLYGGPVISAQKLCEAQRSAGSLVFVFCTTANGSNDLPPHTATIHDVEVKYFHRLTGDHSHFSPSLLWSLWQHCRQYDVIHVHSWWNLVAMPVVLLCLIRGVRPVVSPRGMLSPYTLRRPLKRWFHRWLGRPLLRRCILHATSEQEARHDLVFARPEQIFVAPNLIELPNPPRNTASHAEYFGKENGLRLAFLSRIDPKKGLSLLFHTLSALSDKSWQLVIAGKGELEYVANLQRLAARLGIAGRIEWVGWLVGTRKAALLAEADLLVLPSHNENFANVVLEALALGTPALVTDTVGLADYVRHTGFGWVCAVTEASLLATLEQALDTGGYVGASREEITKQVRQDFDEKKVLNLYLEAYQNNVLRHNSNP